ncbi:unnamed protein product, partial [Candidula unifasciata]
VKILGESFFSARPGSEPVWAAHINSTQLREAVNIRINYLTGITKGKVDRWIVNNQLLHGRYYEDRLGDKQFSQQLFKAIGAADPFAELILNDLDVVATGNHNLGYVDQINAFKEANVGLKGVGIIGRFADNIKPDITLVKGRLDKLAETGLPLWITGLTIGSTDVHEKADCTHVTQSLTSGTSFTVRGFHGDYAAVVYYKGKPLQRSSFTLGKADRTVTIDVTSTTTIQLPPIVDPFAPQDIDFATSSLNLQTIGHGTSTSQSQQLQCVSRRSAVSEVGDEKTATVSCNAGEVLTGCSSFSTNNDWQRDGEQVTFVNGKAVCTAFNGYYSSAGVQAEARCCSLRTLQCRYRTAGPSGTGERDEVIIPCADTEYPLGCGTWTFEAESAGTIFTSTFCVGQNDDIVVGVYGFASCCQATPSLHCITMYSEFSGPNVGDRALLTCPSEYSFTLTGCNVHAPNGRGAGAFIE